MSGELHADLMTQVGESNDVLARILSLARRARSAASVAELGFIAVNETRDLLPYRQAVFWLADGGVATLSGVVAPEANAPYVLWLQRVLCRLASADFSGDATQPLRLTASNLPAHDAGEWNDWLPEFALWLPFHGKGGSGGWLLARDASWRDEELALLQEWQLLWAQAWALQHAEQAKASPWRRTLATLKQVKPSRQAFKTLLQAMRHVENWRHFGRWLLHTRRGRITLAVGVVLLFPVRLSVIAPGQLVPANPSVIRSPLDGIVERILVQPSQTVQAGTPLIEFDRISLASRLEVALQALATAAAEYRQYAQQALSEPKAKAQMAAAQGRIEEKRAEVAYLDALNKRAILTAPRAGIALLDDPSEWVGRPVSTGERILMVADEKDAEIEAWLSPADLIELPEDAEVTIYLNARPLSPVSGTVRYVTHEAMLQPEGQYAYRLRAKLSAGENAPRVGLKGSVKVNGRFVPLSYWVLRKPLAVARAFIGI
jgi:biotin carboxyl carrier protein